MTTKLNLLQKFQRSIEKNPIFAIAGAAATLGAAVFALASFLFSFKEAQLQAEWSDKVRQCKEDITTLNNNYLSIRRRITADSNSRVLKIDTMPISRRDIEQLPPTYRSIGSGDVFFDAPPSPDWKMLEMTDAEYGDLTILGSPSKAIIEMLQMGMEQLDKSDPSTVWMEARYGRFKSQLEEVINAQKIYVWKNKHSLSIDAPLIGGHKLIKTISPFVSVQIINKEFFHTLYDILVNVFGDEQFGNGINGKYVIDKLIEMSNDQIGSVFIKMYLENEYAVLVTSGKNVTTKLYSKSQTIGMSHMDVDFIFDDVTTSIDPYLGCSIENAGRAYIQREAFYLDLGRNIYFVQLQIPGCISRGSAAIWALKLISSLRFLE